MAGYKKGKDSKKPKPEMLGSGMAYGAGKKLKGRKSRIDAAIEGSVKGDYKAKKKK